MKKILIICEYFYPDVASTGQLLTELCEELQNDYKITVLTSVPSFKMEEYSSIINFEKYMNIDLVRVKTKPFKKHNKFSRIKHVIEHYRLMRKAIRKLDKQDIVFTISQPPILGGLQGIYGKRVHSAKFIYNIQDFNPEQAETVGYFKFKLIYQILRKIDTNICKNADRIILVGSDMLKTLEKRGVPLDDRVMIINNWIDEADIYPLDDDNVSEFKLQNDIEDKLVIMYSGNIGLYYDLENIVEVFKEFKDRKDIAFIFVGDGAKKHTIEKQVKSQEIANIKFIPFQEKKDILYSLNAADVHLVCNQKGIKGVSVPSKIYGVMAVGKYVLGVLEEGSEAASLITKSGCGIVIEPGDYDGILDAINKVINSDPKDLKAIGLKGREYLEHYLSKKRAMEGYRKVFEG